MDTAWLIAVAAFFGGSGLAIKWIAHLRSED
jgi:hypothetical protein